MIITAMVWDLIIVETSIKIAFSLFATKPQHTALYQSIYATKCATRMTLTINLSYCFSCCLYFSFNFSQKYFSTCQHKINTCGVKINLTSANCVIHVLCKQYNILSFPPFISFLVLFCYFLVLSETVHETFLTDFFK